MLSPSNLTPFATVPVAATGPLYNAFYQTLLDKLQTDGVAIPNDLQKVKDNQLLSTLDLAGQINTHTALYILGWHHHEAALYNWVNPNAYKCSYVGSMTVSEFTPQLGYNTKAASAINTGIAPFTSGSPIDSNNTTLWMWVDNLSASNVYMGTLDTTKQCYMGVEGGIIYSRINTNGSSATENCGAVGSGKSMLALKRISATQVEVWINGVHVRTEAKDYFGICEDFIYLCGVKFSALPGGVYVPESNVRVYAAGIGGNIDVSVVYSALLLYKS